MKYRQALPKYSEKISPDHTLLHATSAATYQIKLTICLCVWYTYIYLLIYTYIVLRYSSLSHAKLYVLFFSAHTISSGEKKGTWRVASIYPPSNPGAAVPAEPKEINCRLIYVSRPHFCTRANAGETETKKKKK